jgi:hypothetical protein
VPIRISSGMGYPIPQVAQLPEEQLPQAEDAEEAVTWLSPPGPLDLDTNPHFDMSRDRSGLLQEGHTGAFFPITRASNSFWHALH